MRISKKQKELDIIKWNKSVETGVDACGTFDYCSYCDKQKNNPCATAFNNQVKANSDKIAATVVKNATKTKSTSKKTVATKKSAKK